MLILVVTHANFHLPTEYVLYIAQLPYGISAILHISSDMSCSKIQDFFKGRAPFETLLDLIMCILYIGV